MPKTLEILRVNDGVRGAPPDKTAARKAAEHELDRRVEEFEYKLIWGELRVIDRIRATVLMFDPPEPILAGDIGTLAFVLLTEAIRARLRIGLHFSQQKSLNKRLKGVASKHNILMKREVKTPLIDRVTQGKNGREILRAVNKMANEIVDEMFAERPFEA